MMGWMELVDYLAVSKQMRAVEPDGALCSAPAKREVEMTDRALLQQALNALTGDPATRSEAYVEDVTDALRARLAEPDVAEPVAWRWRWSETEQWQYTNEWRDVPSSATDIEALYHAGLAELERGPIGEIERLRYTEKQMQKARDEIGLLRADCEDLRNELDRWKESNRAAIVEGGKLMEENERLREEVERLRPLAQYGMAVIEAHREDCSDLDGDWLEDTAKRLGLLTAFTATEACCDECRCATFMWDNDWPTECLRYSQAARDGFAALAAIEKRPEEK